MIVEVSHLAGEYGPWGVVVLAVLLVSRSRPGRELSRVVAAEIRWRYLRTKEVSTEELRELLLHDLGGELPELAPSEQDEREPPQPQNRT